MVQKGVTSVKLAMEKLEHFLELGGTKKDITLLVISGIALIASVCIGEDFTAGEVAFIMQLGGLLEELTVARARAGIEKLVHLTPQTARVILGGKETAVPAEAVKVGDLLRVLPGETIPVDGEIVSGQTSVNQAVMAGESLPVDKGIGDEVSSGTVNQFGAFEMKAAKVGEDSSIQRMIRLVQSADAGKAKIVGLSDRWATWIVVIALTAAALTWLISGEIIRAVTILVVFCPCALVLATPTAIMAAIGKATKHGFLVREGDALERLAAVKKITFDKTGTLTYGTPRVVLVHSALPSLTDSELYRLCAAAERYSEHPLGKAITHCCQQETGEALEEGENFQMVPGRGVSARVDEKVILAGNAELLAEHHIAIPEEAAKAADTQLSQGCTVTYTAVDGVGSDIAVDAADIALVDDEVKELPHLIALSKRMMRTIKLNITFSLTLNFIAIVLAITGTLNPVVGALVHNAGSVLVITNSALLLKWRQTASQSFASAGAKSV